MRIALLGDTRTEKMNSWLLIGFLVCVIFGSIEVGVDRHGLAPVFGWALWPMFISGYYVFRLMKGCQKLAVEHGEPDATNPTVKIAYEARLLQQPQMQHSFRMLQFGFVLTWVIIAAGITWKSIPALRPAAIAEMAKH